MIENVGGDVDVWESYEDTYGLEHLGYDDWGPTFNDIAVKSRVRNYYTWNTWMNLGNGVRIRTYNTPGHTQGCGSFKFECTDDATGEVTTFGYIGGIGTLAAPSNGVKRLQFVAMLRYMQQYSVCDYALPQHCAHYPTLEINKAGEAAHLSFMDAELTGEDVWLNYLEWRMEHQEYDWMLQRFNASPVMTVELADGTQKTVTMKTANARRITNDAAGPWKRAAGEYTITLLDDGKLVHGFDGRINVNPLFAGVTNLAGEDLSNGILCIRDGYVHNPDTWYVQIGMHVADDYNGELMNLPNEVNGPIDVKTGKTTKGTNGPVERLILGDDWLEVNRTIAFNSKEEAEAVLATIQAGKSYKVTMDRNSNIIADNILDTFKEVTAEVEVTEAAAPAAGQMAYDVTFTGTGDAGIGAIVFNAAYDEALTLVDVQGTDWTPGDVNIVVNEDIAQGESCTVTLIFDVPANQTVDPTITVSVKSASDMAENDLSFPTDEAVSAAGFIVGDANEDGRVAASDLVRLRNYIGTNGDGVTVGAGADINADGEVTGLDLTALNRYFATLVF